MPTANRRQSDRASDTQFERAGRAVEVVHYLVDSTDWEEVKLATGLPQPFDAISGDRPQIKVTGRRPVGKATRGHTLVAIEYEEIERGGFGGAGLPEPGLVLTEVEVSVEAETFRVERLPDGTAGRPIPGDGVPAMVPTFGAVVRVYYPDELVAQIPSIADLFRLYAGKVNSGPVILPNVGYSGTGVPMNAGEVLYIRPHIGRENGIRVVSHTLDCKVTHDVTIVRQGADGTPGAEEVFSRYERVSMFGAWPLAL